MPEAYISVVKLRHGSVVGCRRCDVGTHGEQRYSRMEVGNRTRRDLADVLMSYARITSHQQKTWRDTSSESFKFTGAHGVPVRKERGKDY